MASSPRAARAVVLGALASAALSLAPLAAHANTVTFTGGISGYDPLGGIYNTALGPYGSDAPESSPNFINVATFGETATTNQLYGGPNGWSTFNGHGVTDARSFTFTYTGSQPLAFNQDFDTGFSQDDGTGAWTEEVLSANTIRFVAPTGGLTAGTQFDFTVGFVDPTTGSPYSVVIDPSKFSFSATWSDGVPEPATWSMMIVGLGLLGGALRLNQRKVAAGAAA